MIFLFLRMVQALLYSYSAKIMPTSNTKKITLHPSKKDVSIRIQQWLRSIKNNREIIKPIKYRQKTESGVSNNATSVPELQTRLVQPTQAQLRKHLNGWHCLQILYHRACDYTLGMSLSQVTRSIMSNSEEILILSTSIQPFLQRQSTHQVMNQNIITNKNINQL
jgi:hypothetical protein